MRVRYDDGGPPEQPEHPREAIVDEILRMRETDQKSVINEEHGWSKDKWIGRILYDLYQALDEPTLFRISLISAASQILGTLEAEALGYFNPPAQEGTPEEPY